MTKFTGGRSEYVGRFAPSPTGPLHLGSLIAALASFLDARANNGKWLLRMEDLDPPREPPGAAVEILDQLSKLGLSWDGDVLYQSQRGDAYQQALTDLSKLELCFPCDCTRPQIKAMGSVYDGSCRVRQRPPETDFAIRLRTDSRIIGIDDLIQGHYQQSIESDVGDFVIRRKDRLIAYQLAVVVDDAYQQITDIIRGYDLLDSTPRQIYLQQCLGYPTPRYGHIPVIVNELGQKLSKQHFATPVAGDNSAELIHLALHFLGQSPPAANKTAPPATQLEWAIEHWDIQLVPKLANIPESTLK